MKNSTMFIRGQVWYWEDPMFGRKENHANIAIGEATIRYNRYCIIIQDTNTIESNSVLVIPCSSTNNTPHDVKVPLAHTFKENFTYAKTRSLFPVHPKFLNRYVCTLPDEIMSLIDAEIIKLLLPAVTKNMDDDTILSTLGIDMNKSMEIKIDSRDINIDVRGFIQSHIVAGNEEDIVRPMELKEAFDQYCIINQIPVVEDIVHFLDSFTYVVNGSSYNLTDRFNYNSMEFKRMKLKNNLKLSIDVDSDKLPSEVTAASKKKWDDKSIREFLQFYIDHGLEEVMQEYNLRASTAKAYWSKWNSKMNVQDTKKIPLPTTSEIQRAISKISNMIRDSLKNDGLFECLGDVKVNGYKIYGEEFYDRIGSTIYFTFIDFLGIIQHDWKKCYIPMVTENSPNLATWHFLDKCYHDKRISTSADIDRMVELYRKFYGEINDGINVEWIDKFKTKIKNKFEFDPVSEETSIEFTCELIKERCCRTM